MGSENRNNNNSSVSRRGAGQITFYYLNRSFIYLLPREVVKGTPGKGFNFYRGRGTMVTGDSSRSDLLFACGQ